MTLDPDSVPSSLMEAVAMLKAGVSMQEISLIKQTDPEDLCSHLHFYFGRRMRNNWNLWEKDAPLVRWFHGIGITHPDDMSAIINISFFRDIRGEGIRLDEQVKHYQDYWTKTLGRPIP